MSKETVIDLPEVGDEFRTQPAAFSFEGEGDGDKNSSAPAAAGITTEQLEAILSRTTSSANSQQAQLLEAIKSLTAKPQDQKPTEPEIDILKLLDQDEAIGLGEQNVSVFNKLAKTLLSSSNAQVSALENQINMLKAQLQSKFVEDFRKDGGDVLDTPQGKSFMQEVDPNTGLTRQEGVERLGRSYLDSQVKAANAKFKRAPAVSNGGSSQSAVSSSTAITKIEDALEALRRKPQSQLTPADSEARTKLWSELLRLKAKSE